jgi:hypothetical protein
MSPENLARTVGGAYAYHPIPGIHRGHSRCPIYRSIGGGHSDTHGAGLRPQWRDSHQQRSNNAHAIILSKMSAVKRARWSLMTIRVIPRLDLCPGKDPPPLAFDGFGVRQWSEIQGVWIRHWQDFEVWHIFDRGNLKQRRNTLFFVVTHGHR